MPASRFRTWTSRPAVSDCVIRGDFLAHFDKGANDIDTHGNRTRAIEDRCHHQGALFGEGEREVLSVPAPASF